MRLLKLLDTLVAMVILCAISSGMAGCAWIVNLAASSDGSSLGKTTKSFDIPKAAKELTECVAFRPSKDKPTGICPVPRLVGAAPFQPTPLDSSFNVEWITSAGNEMYGPTGATEARNAAAMKAAAVLNNPVQRAIDALFNSMNGFSGPAAPGDGASPRSADVPIKLEQLEAYLSSIEKATADGGWDALANVASSSRSIPPESRRMAAYISAYMTAYFRHGKFFSAKLDASAYKTQLIGKLSEGSAGLSKSDAQQIADQLFQDAGLKDGTVTLGSIATDGFVSRGGQSLIIPEVQLTVSLPGGKINRPQINYTLVGTDIVRVFLNAVFDSTLATPSASGATGGTIMTDNGAGTSVDVGLLTFAPDEFSKPRNGHNAVSPDEFGAIETRASQVDAASAAGIGRIVRGAGFVSLNNEALASVIETIIGVTLRKGAEKVLWCWYACAAPTPNNPKEQYIRADYHAMSPLSNASVTVTITGRETVTNLSGTATKQ
jgi:hypothetical protein